ncbi:hypothetical protein KJ632_02385 [Patescibacteria group bacterium]|nr:hypothetical protein [Patescibacteria group bacterium]
MEKGPEFEDDLPEVPDFWGEVTIVVDLSKFEKQQEKRGFLRDVMYGLSRGTGMSLFSKQPKNEEGKVENGDNRIILVGVNRASTSKETTQKVLDGFVERCKADGVIVDSINFVVC